MADAAVERMVTDLVATSANGVAVLDAEGSCVYANAAARRLLADHKIAGQEIADVGDLLEDHSLAVTSWPFVSAGQRLTAFEFHEAKRVQRQLRGLAAFASTAARIACCGSLQDVLDRVAVEARNASGALACSIILLEPDASGVRLLGTAGHTDDYADCLLRSVQLGAPLASIDAFRTGRPARRNRLRDADDPRFVPFQTEAGGWVDVVAVPSVIQGRCVGVLTSFFGQADEPGEDDLTFLAALADQTATAVDNANLVAELQATAAVTERRNLAIDLHDSVSQALFSVIMQSRALAMRAQGHDEIGGPDLLDAVGRLEATAEEMQREVRGLLREMQPENPQPADLREELAVLRDQLAALTRSGSPELRLELPDARTPSVDGATRQELLRVIREAVINSVRHAAASVITIKLTTASGALTAVVADNGVGLSQASFAPGHLGLQSMTRRTERLGGQLEIDTSATGTAVHVTLPLRSYQTKAET